MRLVEEKPLAQAMMSTPSELRFDRRGRCGRRRTL